MKPAAISRSVYGSPRDDVPTHAITLTVPAIMACKRIFQWCLMHGKPNGEERAAAPLIRRVWLNTAHSSGGHAVLDPDSAFAG